ncbi:MAG: hypothetical protein WCF90_02115 [Methanomicrobiales archaeon]
MIEVQDLCDAALLPALPGLRVKFRCQSSGSWRELHRFLITGMEAISVLFTSVFSGIQIIWAKQFGFLK